MYAWGEGCTKWMRCNKGRLGYENLFVYVIYGGPYCKFVKELLTIQRSIQCLRWQFNKVLNQISYAQKTCKYNIRYFQVLHMHYARTQLDIYKHNLANNWNCKWDLEVKTSRTRLHDCIWNDKDFWQLNTYSETPASTYISSYLYSSYYAQSY